MDQRVAITGAEGQLGRQVVMAYRASGATVLPLGHADLDLEHPDTRALELWRPGLVVNCAAWTDVDGCARDPERARRINGAGAGAVAAAAARVDAGVIQLSTNEVFDGELGRPYREDDLPRPVNAYGESKLAGERAVAEAADRHLIVRTAWLFGPGGRNFVTKIVAAAERARAAGEPLRVVDDEWGNPTWTPDLAAAIVRLQPDRGRVVHVAGQPAASRHDWARVALDAAGLDVQVVPISRTEFVRDSSPPARAILAASAGVAEIGWREPTVAYAAGLAQAPGATRAAR